MKHFGMAVLLVAAAGAQDKPNSKVDQARIDAAIANGVSYLRGQMDLILNRDIYLTWERTNQGSFKQKFVELTLLTMIHAGVDREDPDLKRLVDAMLAAPLQTTYRAALQAMALQKLDPRKHQMRIAQCGQVLIDSQCQNGQWCYGHETDIGSIPPAKDEPAVPTKGFGKNPKPPSEPPLPRIGLTKRRNGCPTGDASNSQYAALGLRACIESGVIVPADVLRKAKEAWERTQGPDGSWSYEGPSNVKQRDHPPGTYGSMTMGGIAALCILKHYLKEPVKGDPKIAGAIQWAAKNFTVSQNPGYKHHLFYYLYAMERAGDLTGSETLGPHEWYPAGAKFLLEKQGPGGEWPQGEIEAHVAATCFAILFLRRATTPLPKIATGTGK